MTIPELLARVSLKGDQAKSFIEYGIGTTSEKVRVYYLQPICLLLPGESFSVDAVQLRLQILAKV
jgi:hypothetical protein